MAAAVYCLWRSQQSDNYARWALMTGCALYCVFTVMRLVRLVYMNWRLHRGWTRGEIIPRSSDNSTFELKVNLARPMRVVCGQYAHLVVPGASKTAVFQRHPFNIAWWEENSTGMAVTLSFLIKPGRGLTSRLANLKGPEGRPMVAVEGPYGRGIDLARYRAVFLFASGMGIAAVMPFLKAAIMQRQDWRSRVERVAISWTIDHVGKLTHCDYGGGYFPADPFT